MNRRVEDIWIPQPKQVEFLAAAEDEVLYGGAAGGGKSESLLIDALGGHQDAIEYPSYRAILFRKTYPELVDLIDRSKELYKQIAPGAKYNGTDKEWRFPSGAAVRFGYMARPTDRFEYQGHEYAYVGWDELTQQETDAGYKYLLSRLRTTETRLSVYVRATCNPGGVGHAWVKDRWQVPDDGAAIAFMIDLPDPRTGGTRTWHRRFIPARIADNKYLANTDYASQLHMLSEIERKALLDGRWDVVEIVGAIYQDQITEAYAQKRVTSIPIERTLPVYTGWDLGRNDHTAVWMMQYVGMEKRFVGYHAKRFQTISYWGRYITDWAKEHKVIVEAHYMPHDVEVKQLSLSNASRREMFEQMGVSPIHVVERIPRLEDGIDMTREFLTGCYFDAGRCAEGLKALANYRRQYNETNDTYSLTPLHNWASNGSDAIRQLAQGFMPPERFGGHESFEPEPLEDY